MGPVENLCCLRCNREIEAGQKSVAVYMFAQTVGVRPRQKSSANRICFCPQCAVSLAMGLPPEGALNMALWDCSPRRKRNLRGESAVRADHQGFFLLQQ